jgi:hypothetical protein
LWLSPAERSSDYNAHSLRQMALAIYEMPFCERKTKTKEGEVPLRMITLGNA